MTWHQDSWAVEVNAQDYQWDPVTWLLLPIPLIPLALEGVKHQQHSDLSGEDRSSVVASVGHTENEIGSNTNTSSSELPKVSQWE